MPSSPPSCHGNCCGINTGRNLLVWIARKACSRSTSSFLGSTRFIFHHKCSCGTDGNCFINVKCVGDLGRPWEMTNHRGGRWREAGTASRQKMETKEDWRTICVKVRAGVMNTCAPPPVSSFGATPEECQGNTAVRQRRVRRRRGRGRGESWSSASTHNPLCLDENDPALIPNCFPHLTEGIQMPGLSFTALDRTDSGARPLRVLTRSAST